MVEKLSPALTATLFGLGTGFLSAIAQLILSKRLSEQGREVPTGEIVLAVAGSSVFNFVLAYWLSRERQIASASRKRIATRG